MNDPAKRLIRLNGLHRYMSCKHWIAGKSELYVTHLTM
jgi:hypothetical protein